jgi:hypothetical protein
MYSVSNLFSPTTSLTYCSAVGPNITVTGVLTLTPEKLDLHELFVNANRLFIKNNAHETRRLDKAYTYDILYSVLVNI